MKTKQLLTLLLMGILSLTLLVGCGGGKEETKESEKEPTVEEIKHTMIVKDALKDQVALYKAAIHGFKVDERASSVSFNFDYENENSNEFKSITIRYILDGNYFIQTHTAKFYVDDFLEGKFGLNGNEQGMSLGVNKESQGLLKPILDGVLKDKKVILDDSSFAFIIDSKLGYNQEKNETELKIRVDFENSYTVFKVLIKNAKTNEELVKSYQAGDFEYGKDAHKELGKYFLPAVLY